MKKAIFLLLILLVMLSGCGNKVDDEVLKNISDGLKNRWEYTDTLGDDKTIDNYETAINKELEFLKEYDSDDFKDFDLYFLYDNYRRELKNGLHILELAGISEKELGRDWNKHLEKRGEALKELNSKYELKIPSEYKDIFNDVIEFTAVSSGPGNDTELTEIATMNYMEQITFRYLNASKLENDSFEQKSELQACIGRVESITEELEEKYPEDDSLVIRIIELGKKVNKGCQDKLNGNHDLDYDNSFSIGEDIGYISQTYMNGELPPTAKQTIQSNE